MRRILISTVMITALTTGSVFANSNKFNMDNAFPYTKSTQNSPQAAPSFNEKIIMNVFLISLATLLLIGLLSNGGSGNAAKPSPS